MDDARTTGILTGAAAGGTLAAMQGGIVPADPWAASLGAAALLAWLVALRRGGPLARPAAAAADRPHVLRAGAEGPLRRREPQVLLRETTDPERDSSLNGGSSNGGSPRTRRPSSAPAEPKSEDPSVAPAGSDPERRDAVAHELERLADGLEDEDSAGEEISFLPPYASDEAGDAAESEGQRGDAWDPLLETAESDREGPGRPDGKMPLPRHFALGTVAVIRRLLEPEEVERILSEQRRYPRLRFGDVAVQLGLLSETQLQELLMAQQEGLFSEAEIREARERLRTFRRGGTASRR